MFVLFLPSATTVFLLAFGSQAVAIEQDNSHFLIRYVYRFSCLLMHPNMVCDVEICVEFGQIKNGIELLTYLDDSIDRINFGALKSPTVKQEIEILR